MNRPAILITAFVVVAIGLANVILGLNLITPLAVATERGAGVPWYIVWAMVLLTLGSALALGGFLLSSLRPNRH
jgi:hypothetical protein